MGQGVWFEAADQCADGVQQFCLAAVGDDDAAADDDQVVGDDLDLVQEM
jgi:hypothetical protein